MDCILCGHEDTPDEGLLCEACHDKATSLKERLIAEWGCTEEELTNIVRQNARRQRLMEEAIKSFMETHDEDDHE